MDTKFTTVEIREMEKLLNCYAVLSNGTINNIDKKLLNDELAKQYKILTNFPELKDIDRYKKKIIEFKFYNSPIEILGDNKITGIKLKNNLSNENNTEDTIIDCGIIISAIGYEGNKISKIESDKNGMILHKDNIIKKGLYTVGWISRGLAVIGTNKHDGIKVAQHIFKDIRESNKPGRKRTQKITNYRIYKLYI